MNSPTTSPHPSRLAYVVEGITPWWIAEYEEVAREGNEPVIFLALRIGPLADADAERLRQRAHYYPDTLAQAAWCNLRTALRRPRTFLSLAVSLLRTDEPLRALVLAACFAQLIPRMQVGHLHAVFGTRAATVAALAAQLAGIDFSLSTHAFDIFRANRSLEWKTKTATFMRTISDYNRNYILRTYRRIPAEKVRVCRLGVDVVRFSPTPQESALESDTPLILSAASLVPKKGHDLLLRACAILRQRGEQFRCEIVGEGTCKQDLIDLIAALGIGEYVQLTGARRHCEIPALLRSAAIFVLPCRDVREAGGDLDGIPVVLMEAMATALPVVTTRVSGIPELVEDNASGCLVPGEDPAALALALQSLLHDPTRRRRLGEAGRQRILEAFEIRRSTRCLLNWIFPGTTRAGRG